MMSSHPTATEGIAEFPLSAQSLVGPRPQILFAMEILENIFSTLGFDDLKRCRIVCSHWNGEAVKALAKMDMHWIYDPKEKDLFGTSVGRSRQYGLDQALGAVEHSTDAKVPGWLFRRLLLKSWNFSQTMKEFLWKWGHHLKEVHLKGKPAKRNQAQGDKSDLKLVLNIHSLLTQWCPNLKALSLEVSQLELSPESKLEIESLTFTTQLKLTQIQIKNHKWPSDKAIDPVVQKYLARMIISCGCNLDGLIINHVELRNVNQFLLSLTLDADLWVQNLRSLNVEMKLVMDYLIPKATLVLPKLESLTMSTYFLEGVRDITNAFPSLKNLTLLKICTLSFESPQLLNIILQFPNLESLSINFAMSQPFSKHENRPLPVVESLKSLKLFSLHSMCPLHMLADIVKIFPNLEKLDLLEMGQGWEPDEEYSVPDLVRALAGLIHLSHFYFNFPFTTNAQVAEAIRLCALRQGFRNVILAPSNLYHTVEEFDSQCLNIDNCDLRTALLSLSEGKCLKSFIFFDFQWDDKGAVRDFITMNDLPVTVEWCNCHSYGGDKKSSRSLLTQCKCRHN